MLKDVFKRLKTIFNDCWNGPYYPAPEIKKALEDKGYKFAQAIIPAPHGGAINVYNIYTAEGELLSRKDGTLQTYLDTYEQTVQEFKARGDASAPSRNNKPEPK